MSELKLDKDNAFIRSYYDNCHKCIFYKEGEYLKKYEKIVEILLKLENSIFKHFYLVQAFHLQTDKEEN